MKINAKAIETLLCEHLRQHVVAAGVSVEADTDLESLGVDSVTLIELTMVIEDAFAIEIPVRFIYPEQLRTVSSMAACALKHGLPKR
jgi:acyl carrier protein